MAAQGTPRRLAISSPIAVTVAGWSSAAAAG
jgi:hypothetical protein